MSESQEPELRVKGFSSRGWLWVDAAAATSRETQLVKVENSHLSQNSFWSCGSSEGSVSRDIYAHALHSQRESGRIATKHSQETEAC